MRDFDEWFKTLQYGVTDYSYFIDFDKVYENVEQWKPELHLINSLVGSKNIEEDFIKLVKNYPKVLECIPVLLAVRLKRNKNGYSEPIVIYDGGKNIEFDFSAKNFSSEIYLKFMDKTGLFELLSNRIISNVVDYVTGVETGLNSNARKNRSGTLMETKVEKILIENGFVENSTYFKQMTDKKISDKWKIDLSSITNNGINPKKFDFVIFNNNKVFAVEVNYYGTSGSKPNETARSYKFIADASKKIENFQFVWITDGPGWRSSTSKLMDTFANSDHVYNLKDLESGGVKKIFS